MAQERGVIMNLERLNQNKVDMVLAQFIARAGVENLVENATFNRGDFFEMAITKEPVKRSGLHEVSKGDFVLNGMVVEIKYLTKKTKASKDLRGTLATHYLIGFNNGNEIELRLIAKRDLVVRADNRIAYQDNINKGVRL